MTEPDDLVEVVRRGYDALSERYRADDAPTGQYAPWLADLIAAVPPRGHVLDAGCGNGVPVARDLAAAGLAVTGVDVSDVQIERARRLVPQATFLATVGHTAWTGTEPGWLGGDATMAWSQADAGTYREWVTAAGFEVTAETFVPEGDSGHVLLRARRRSGGDR